MERSGRPYQRCEGSRPPPHLHCRPLGALEPAAGLWVSKDPHYGWQESDLKHDMIYDLQYKHGALMAGVNSVDPYGWDGKARGHFLSINPPVVVGGI